MNSVTTVVVIHCQTVDDEHELGSAASSIASVLNDDDRVVSTTALVVAQSAHAQAVGRLLVDDIFMFERDIEELISKVETRQKARQQLSMSIVLFVNHENKRIAERLSVEARHLNLRVVLVYMNLMNPRLLMSTPSPVIRAQLPQYVLAPSISAQVDQTMIRVHAIWLQQVIGASGYTVLCNNDNHTAQRIFVDMNHDDAYNNDNSRRITLIRNVSQNTRINVPHAVTQLARAMTRP
jgi:hypothetical protein